MGKGSPYAQLRQFPELKFTYEQEAQPEEFFTPYIWAMVVEYCAPSGLTWDSSKILVFDADARDYPPLLEEEGMDGIPVLSTVDVVEPEVDTEPNGKIPPPNPHPPFLIVDVIVIIIVIIVISCCLCCDDCLHVVVAVFTVVLLLMLPGAPCT